MKEDIGKLILRVMVGGMLLFHGLDKMQDGVEMIKFHLTQKGISGSFAYFIFISEVIAPLLLILGWKSRIWASVIAFQMVMAIYLVYVQQIFAVGQYGQWAIEVEMFYLLSAIAIATLGSGRYAIMRD